MTQSENQVRLGQQITLQIDKVANGGFCVGRYNGQAVFVRNSLPGELVIADVTEVNKRYLRATATQILEPNQHRITPPCQYAAVCGGCDWQHADLNYQRDLKSAVVIEQLMHLGDVEKVNGKPINEFKVQPLSSGETGFRYRTRNRYANIANYSIGMRMPRSHSVIEIEDCLIAAEDSTRLAQSALHLGSAEIATAQSSTGQLVLVDQTGGPWLDEVVEDRSWRLHAGSFWQVHKDAPTAFVHTVRKLAQLKTGDRLLDLYSGAGLFAACLAKDVGDAGIVTAVESSIDSVRDARRSCSDLANLDLITSDVAKWLKMNTDSYDVVILDPPRNGAGEEVISQISKIANRTIVYVACDPSALGRDTGYLLTNGWQIDQLVGFDAFPQTAHVECIATFIKK